MHTYVYFDSLLGYEDGEWGLVIMDWVMQQFHYTSAPSNDPDIISVQANLFPNCAFHADECVLTFYFQRVCMLALEVLLGTE